MKNRYKVITPAGVIYCEYASEAKWYKDTYGYPCVKDQSDGRKYLKNYKPKQHD